MGGKRRSNQNLRAAAAALGLLCATPLLGGCAIKSHAGISFAVGAADPELQSLAMHAQAGDKQAQLELGIIYEEGRGVGRNINRAKALYRQAAKTSGGVTYVYSPPVGQARGQVIPVQTGVRAPGLAEAGARLARLEGRNRKEEQ